MTIEDVNALRTQLVENGYRTVAVRTGQKRPVEDRWERLDAFRPARTGALSTGLRCGADILCIDVDRDDPDEVKDVLRRVVGVLGETPLMRTRANSPRVALVYRAGEAGIKKSVIPLAPPLDGKRQQIEVLADGQQFVAFGDHDSGVAYEWPAMSPREVRVADLPAIDLNDIIALHEEFGSELGSDETDEKPDGSVPPRPIGIISASLSSGDRERKYAETALAGEAREVASTGEGGRNARLNQAALKIGHMVGAGWIAETVVAETLDEAARAAGLRGSEITKTIRSGLTAGKAVPADPLPPADIPERDPVREEFGARVAANLLKSSTAKAVVVDEEYAIDPLDRRYSHDHPEWPDGVLGEMTEWILSTATKPNRPLAVAAAIAVMAGVCARVIVGPTGALTQMFMVGLGPSGSGKDWPLVAARLLLRAGGMPNVPTGFKVTSVGAIDLILRTNPCRVGLVDEVGDTLFARMSAKSASTHESAISGALRTLWGVQHRSEYETSSRASGTADVIMRPSLSIFGVSTYDQFFRNVAPGDLENGFLNRWLMVEGQATVGEFQTIDPEKTQVPEALAARIKSAGLPAGHAGNLTGGTIGASNPNPPAPHQIKWHSEAARELYERFRGELDLWVSRGEGPMRSACYERVSEMSVRLGTLAAVSRGGVEASVTERDIRWGISWAIGSARYLMREMALRWYESAFQKDFKRIEQLFKTASKGQLTRTQLTRKVNGRISKFVLEQIVDTLVDAGKIRRDDSGGKTKKTTVYQYMGRIDGMERKAG